MKTNSNCHTGWGCLMIAVSVIMFLYIIMTVNYTRSDITEMSPIRWAKRSFGKINQDFAEKHDVSRAFQEVSYTVRRFFETNKQDIDSGNAGETRADETLKTGKGKAIRKLVDNRDKRPGHDHDTRVSRVNVMLIAYYRSGSSFMGEMFNRNPNAFYLFEPIHVLRTFFEKKYSVPLLQNTLVRHLLDTVYSCAFEEHPLYSHTVGSSAFRLKSEALSSSYCDPRATHLKMHLCKALNATTLSRICRSRPLVVVKTIRMKNWKNFHFLINKQIPFKVIHLVRDPRAIVASRVLWLWRQIPRGNGQRARAVKKALVRYVSIQSTFLCNQMENDLRNLKKETRHFVVMIRYEDAAEKPLTAYDEIYKFVGAPPSDEVRQWLLSNTNVDRSADYFSTTRQSSAAACTWRRRMPMVLVAAVQKQCRKVLDSLKYKVVKNGNELQDMSQSLVLPWTNGKLVQTN